MSQMTQGEISTALGELHTEVQTKVKPQLDPFEPRFRGIAFGLSNKVYDDFVTQLSSHQSEWQNQRNSDGSTVEFRIEDVEVTDGGNSITCSADLYCDLEGGTILTLDTTQVWP